MRDIEVFYILDDSASASFHVRYFSYEVVQRESNRIMKPRGLEKGGVYLHEVGPSMPAYLFAPRYGDKGQGLSLEESIITTTTTVVW